MQPGLFVTPNVRLVSQLGQGGMGSVWLADHLALSSRVAVKFLSPELAASNEARERFSREARSSAQVKSPHIVQVFDQGITADGTPFIVMELLEGLDLGKSIDQRGAIPLLELSKILTQVCRGLGKAHAEGIVHRDIKPDNVFLVAQDGEPFVKILDFGVAKQTGNMAAAGMTSTGAVLGTPYYMSPEQMLGSKNVDPRSDLWSLAVTVYHGVTGQLPFTGESLGALFVAIEHAAFAPPSSARGDIPPELDVWFAKALARNPDDRFQTAREMAEVFEAAVAKGNRASQFPTELYLSPAPKLPSIAGASFSQADAKFAPPRSSKRGVVLAMIGAVVLAGGALLTLALLGRGAGGGSSDGNTSPTPASAAPPGSATSVAATASAPIGVSPITSASPPAAPHVEPAGKTAPPSAKTPKAIVTASPRPPPVGAPPHPPPNAATDRGF